MRGAAVAIFGGIGRRFEQGFSAAVIIKLLLARFRSTRQGQRPTIIGITYRMLAGFQALASGPPHVDRSLATRQLHFADFKLPNLSIQSTIDFNASTKRST
jgi:hypothetical protein